MKPRLSWMQDREYEVDSGRVFGLVAASRRPEYDWEFVALAQALGVSLVTVDRQLLADLDVAVSLDDYVRDG